jgi:hypothetical protein
MTRAGGAAEAREEAARASARPRPPPKRKMGQARFRGQRLYGAGAPGRMKIRTGFSWSFGQLGSAKVIDQTPASSASSGLRFQFLPLRPGSHKTAEAIARLVALEKRAARWHDATKVATARRKVSTAYNKEPNDDDAESPDMATGHTPRTDQSITWTGSFLLLTADAD